jgi:desert hedgehog
MGELAVGDRVHVGRGIFSDVFMFTHKSADVANLFVEMTTVSGSVLRATPGHYLYVNGALSAAKAVVAGDVLELASGAADAVAAVRSVTDFGLYNPQTVQGDVVVDGVRASTYTTAVEPAFAHAALSPLRAVYGVFGAATAALDNGSPLADLLPSGAAAVN